MQAVSRRFSQGLGLVLVAVAVLGAGTASASRSAAMLSPANFAPMPAPTGWRLLVPPSGTSSLWYPPSLRPIPGDAYSVSAALKNRKGIYLVYLNAGPKTGSEEMSTWPSFRVEHLQGEGNTSVHEDGHASGIAFRGGKGSCVVDDYVTRVKGHHYREIACFAQGRTTASVIVAAALTSAWPTYGPQLERAVEAWQVR